MSIRQRIGLIGLILSIIAVLALTMTTTGTDSFHGPLAQAVKSVLRPFLFGRHFTKAQFGFAANIVMFMPFGFFLGMVLQRGKFLNGVVALPMASCFIEALQYFMPTRGTQFEDILANSVGGWIGLGVAWLVVLALESRMQPPSSAPGLPPRR